MMKQRKKTMKNDEKERKQQKIGKHQ